MEAVVEGVDVIAENIAAAAVAEAVEEEVPKVQKVAKAKPPKAEKAVEKKARRIKVPKTIPMYWRAKDKNPELFPFTADGNLGSLVGAEEGKPLETPVKLFDLPIYAPTSREDIDALWATRQSTFDEIYEAIETARTQLREAHAAYRTGAGTAREVVIANQLVAEQEARLITNRSARRWIETVDNPTTNYIDLTQRYETRKIGFDVYQLKQVAIDPQKLLRVLTPEEAAAAGAAKRGGGLPSYGVVTDDTLLGLHWPAEIRVGNTKYFTAFQAILGEIARRNYSQDLFQSLLGTRSSRTMRTLTKDFKQEDYDPEILDSVVKAISKEFPEFREVLLKTGDDTIVYANSEEEIFGIGLDVNALQDPMIQGVSKWRGQNLWGQALERARTEFRQENVVAKKENEGVTEDESKPVENEVISKSQQDAAKKAAIINAKRFHKAH